MDSGKPFTQGQRSFDYREAFSRNIGWLTEREQVVLRRSRVAIAGMGGVGGIHLLTLARLGVGAFRIADLDRFELANMNRQAGAGMSSLGREKVEVMAAAARDINPEVALDAFPDGVNEGNAGAFLAGADLFVDALDFFALEVRRMLFARAAALGIPAVTAAPIGFGTTYFVFLPGGMSFEEYFRLDGLAPERQYVNFAVGLTPRGFHRAYLADPSRMDLAGRRGPSTAAAVQLCAGVVGTEAVKILTGRGRVWPAPWYHQFDAFQGRWLRGRLVLGNRGPLQTLKRQVGYRVYGRLSRNARPAEEPATGSRIERILDLARWAPSGDNAQPWRFELRGANELVVHIHVEGESRNVYDFDGGRPTLLSAGFLLESLRLAASRFACDSQWEYRGGEGANHRIAVKFTPQPGLAEDPLCDFLAARSVDRRRYLTTPLTAAEKAALEAALGPNLAIAWHEVRDARWRMARINARATDIRLRLRAAYEVHRRVLDWDRPFSPDGVPAAAIGLDPMTLRLMRSVMRTWRRVDVMNRFFGGTVMPRFQLDIVPGLACAAHFTVGWRTPPGAGKDVAALLEAGGLLQRFWLLATNLGLVVQPSLAPLCFAHYAGRTGADVLDARGLARARDLARHVDALRFDPATPLVFMGRIGRPIANPSPSRSIRRMVTSLLAPPG